MPMEGHGKSLGTSRNFDVMAKLHMISADMIKLTKGNFKSLRLPNFLIQFILLMHE